MSICRGRLDFGPARVARRQRARDRQRFRSGRACDRSCRRRRRDPAERSAARVVAGPVLVVGPGTGLGAALRIPHMRASRDSRDRSGPGDARAAKPISNSTLCTSCARQSQRVQIEHVLSGTGLVNLHRAIATLRGVDAPARTPAEITAAALAKNDPIAVETVDVFCGWLGARARRSRADCTAREGGIYLAGGVLPQMKDLLMRSTFVERFLDKGVMRERARAHARASRRTRAARRDRRRELVFRTASDRLTRDARAQPCVTREDAFSLEEFHRCSTTKSRRSDARKRVRADTTKRGECHDVP